MDHHCMLKLLAYSKTAAAFIHYSLITNLHSNVKYEVNCGENGNETSHCQRDVADGLTEIMNEGQQAN